MRKKVIKKCAVVVSLVRKSQGNPATDENEHVLVCTRRDEKPQDFDANIIERIFIKPFKWLNVIKIIDVDFIH